MNTAQPADDFLSPFEAEHLISSLKEMEMKEFGSKQWLTQHEGIDRLNIQAHKNALGGTDEYVMENFVTLDKMSTLTYDLILTEVWKDKVFPLIKKDIATHSGIKSYMCLYHEATIVNLMEVMLYHRTACESGEDALVELIDYCYRKFINLTAKADHFYQR